MPSAPEKPRTRPHVIATGLETKTSRGPCYEPSRAARARAEARRATCVSISLSLLDNDDNGEQVMRTRAARSQAVVCQRSAVAVPWPWRRRRSFFLGVASADLAAAPPRTVIVALAYLHAFSHYPPFPVIARAGRDSVTVVCETQRSKSMDRLRVVCAAWLHAWAVSIAVFPFRLDARHWNRVSCTDAAAGDCASPGDAADPGSTYRRPICAVLSIGAHVVAVSKSA